MEKVILLKNSQARDKIVKTFDNGVVLKTCFKTGITGTFVGGELKVTHHNLTIKEYMKLQQDVQDLYISEFNKCLQCGCKLSVKDIEAEIAKAIAGILKYAAA